MGKCWRIAIALCLLGSISPVFAASETWEVAILFLGAHESTEYQADIDRNIFELARTSPGAQFSMGILRELPGHSVQYFLTPETTTSGAVSWNPLLFDPAVPNILIPGTLESTPNSSSILETPTELKRFFRRIFRNESSLRMLLVYGHGLAHRGLRDMPLYALKDVLIDSLPARERSQPGLTKTEKSEPLDILWLDSCYMASLEAVYQLKALASFYVASETSEFASGAPLEALQVLERNSRQPRDVAMDLARAFISSYSILFKGSQAGGVYSSPATISVTETNKIGPVVTRLKELRDLLQPELAKLAEDFRQRIVKSSQQFATDDVGLNTVDLNSLMRFIEKNRYFSEQVRAKAKELGRVLSVANRGALKTNTRLKLIAPVVGARLVFGYNNWSKGYESDSDTLSVVPPELKRKAPGNRASSEIEGYLVGEGQRSWPYRSVKRRLYLTPFAPGLQEFDFYFVGANDSEKLTSLQRIKRLDDAIYFSPDSQEGPIAFVGYTQGIGKSAERFLGLSVLNPLSNAVLPSYLDLDFYQDTGWGR